MLEDIDFDSLPYSSSPADRAGGGTIEDHSRIYVLPAANLVIEFERKFDGGEFRTARIWRLTKLHDSPTSDSIREHINPPTA